MGFFCGFFIFFSKRCGFWWRERWFFWGGDFTSANMHEATRHDLECYMECIKITILMLILPYIFCIKYFCWTHLHCTDMNKMSSLHGTFSKLGMYFWDQSWIQRLCNTFLFHWICLFKFVQCTYLLHITSLH